ncbi:MAG: cytochrome P460 family protein [Planctomycetota bacterium]
MKSLLAFVTIIGACVFGICCKSPETAANAVADSPTIEEIAISYKGFQLMTPVPHQVSLASTTICFMTPERFIEINKEQSGVHAFASINIYMNNPAASSYNKQTNNYPAGSIVIKDKLSIDAPPNRIDGLKYSQKPGVGGMIKRAPGYDPEHGDWEYFYFENPSKITNGRIANCVQCHTNAKDRDYVFGGWAKDSGDK